MAIQLTADSLATGCDRQEAAQWANQKASASEPCS